MNPLSSPRSVRPHSSPRVEPPEVLPGDEAPDLELSLDEPPNVFPVEPESEAGVLSVLPAPPRPTLADWVLAIGTNIYLGLEWLFGVGTLMLGLAVLAAIPIVQFLALGYLLEAGGRVARTGLFRHGFPGVRKAARVGRIAAGVFLWLLPLWLLSDLATAAQLIDPDGPMALRWRVALVTATVLIVLHMAAAIARGGRLRYFFWPFNVLWLYRQIWRGGYYGRARDAACDFIVSLRLPYYFWLGCRGFVGAFVWLAVPVTLLAIGRWLTPVGFVGGLMLAIVLLYLPFLQMRFAAENRLRALFEIGAIRERFQRAPWCFALALFVTLLFALPLYLLKIELVPREITWVPSLVFIVFIFPARLLTGWACGVAEHRRRRAHWFFRWTGFLPMPALTLFYVFLLFFTQYAAWEGVWSLYEQHAFLLPVPFVGL